MPLFEGTAFPSKGDSTVGAAGGRRMTLLASIVVDQEAERD